MIIYLYSYGGGKMATETLLIILSLLQYFLSLLILRLLYKIKYCLIFFMSIFIKKVFENK